MFWVSSQSLQNEQINFTKSFPFQILDYTQYYLDLFTANTNPRNEAEWVVEYNFSTYYGISNITPSTLHILAEKLTLSNPNDNPFFNK